MSGASATRSGIGTAGFCDSSGVRKAVTAAWRRGAPAAKSTGDRGAWGRQPGVRAETCERGACHHTQVQRHPGTTQRPNGWARKYEGHGGTRGTAEGASRAVGMGPAPSHRGASDAQALPQLQGAAGERPDAHEAVVAAGGDLVHSGGAALKAGVRAGADQREQSKGGERNVQLSEICRQRRCCAEKHEPCSETRRLEKYTAFPAAAKAQRRRRTCTVRRKATDRTPPSWETATLARDAPSSSDLRRGRQRRRETGRARGKSTCFIAQATRGRLAAQRHRCDVRNS